MGIYLKGIYLALCALCETSRDRYNNVIGVHGCEIWMKIGGDAPKEKSELVYLATETSTPHIATFGDADAGKIAWYHLR